MNSEQLIEKFAKFFSGYKYNGVDTINSLISYALENKDEELVDWIIARGYEEKIMFNYSSRFPEKLSKILVGNFEKYKGSVLTIVSSLMAKDISLIKEVFDKIKEIDNAYVITLNLNYTNNNTIFKSIENIYKLWEEGYNNFTINIPSLKHYISAVNLDEFKKSYPLLKQIFKDENLLKIAEMALTNKYYSSVRLSAKKKLVFLGLAEEDKAFPEEILEIATPPAKKQKTVDIEEITKKVMEMEGISDMSGDEVASVIVKVMSERM